MNDLLNAMYFHQNAWAFAVYLLCTATVATCGISLFRYLRRHARDLEAHATRYMDERELARSRSIHRAAWGTIAVAALLLALDLTRMPTGPTIPTLASASITGATVAPSTPAPFAVRGQMTQEQAAACDDVWTAAFTEQTRVNRDPLPMTPVLRADGSAVTLENWSDGDPSPFAHQFTWLNRNNAALLPKLTELFPSCSSVFQNIAENPDL